MHWHHPPEHRHASGPFADHMHQAYTRHCHRPKWSYEHTPPCRMYRPCKHLYRRIRRYRHTPCSRPNRHCPRPRCLLRHPHFHCHLGRWNCSNCCCCCSKRRNLRPSLRRPPQRFRQSYSSIHHRHNPRRFRQHQDTAPKESHPFENTACSLIHLFRCARLDGFVVAVKRLRRLGQRKCRSSFTAIEKAAHSIRTSKWSINQPPIASVINPSSIHQPPIATPFVRWSTDKTTKTVAIVLLRVHQSAIATRIQDWSACWFTIAVAIVLWWTDQGALAWPIGGFWASKRRWTGRIGGIIRRHRGDWEQVRQAPAIPDHSISENRKKRIGQGFCQRGRKWFRRFFFVPTRYR